MGQLKLRSGFWMISLTSIPEVVNYLETSSESSCLSFLLLSRLSDAGLAAVAALPVENGRPVEPGNPACELNV